MSLGRRKEGEGSSSPDIKASFQNGRAYLLIGGEPADIRTTCHKCGHGYEGPCQQGCGACAVSRKTYYVDVTNVKLIDGSEKEKIDKASSLVVPSEGVAKFGFKSRASEVVAGKIRVGERFVSELAVCNYLVAGSFSTFGTVVISDGGTAYFGEGNHVKTLVAGRDANLTFGYRSEVTELLTIGNANIEAGEGFKQGNRRMTTYSDIANLIAKHLNT